MAEAAEPQKSALERALGIFTEVKSGEAPTALLLTLNVFLLLSSYYIIKPVREGLVISLGDDGDRYKSYLGGAIAIALFFVVPMYGALVKRLPRNRLVVGVTLFFASHLAVFYGLSSITSLRPKIAIAFFVWVGVFNMMVISQFWAFANDIYDEEAGKRLFALIGIGASSGAAIGSLIGAVLIPVLGVYQMLLVAGAFLVVCAGIVQWVHVRETERKSPSPSPAPPSEPDAEQDDLAIRKQLKATMQADDPDALRKAIDAERTKQEEAARKADAKPSEGSDFLEPYRMVFRYRYLTLIAAFSLLFTLINTNGEFIVSNLVKTEAQALVSAGQIAEEGVKDWIGAWYAEFYLYVNILGAVLQAFVVSRLVKFGGLKLAFLIYPVVAFLDATMLAALPLLALARIGKVVENASDYSINNTARNMLWLPTTRQMKYVAKQAVDSFFIRLGDVGSALFVFLLAGTLHFGPRVFAGVNIILAVITIIVALATLREQPKIRAMRERGELPGDEEPEGA